MATQVTLRHEGQTYTLDVSDMSVRCKTEGDAAATTATVWRARRKTGVAAVCTVDSSNHVARLQELDLSCAEAKTVATRLHETVPGAKLHKVEK